MWRNCTYAIFVGRHQLLPLVRFDTHRLHHVRRHEVSARIIKFLFHGSSFVGHGAGTRKNAQNWVLFKWTRMESNFPPKSGTLRADDAAAARNSFRAHNWLYVYMLDIHNTQTAGRRAGCRKKSIKTFLIKRTRRFWTRGFHRVWRPGGGTLRKMGRDSCLSFESKLV